MAKRTLTYGGSSAAVVVIVLAILGLLNYLGARHFARADLTEAAEYTLADSTRGMLGKLDDLVSVQVYFSRDLPPYLATMTAQVRDMLDEYRAYSNGRISIEYNHPETDRETEQKLMQMGIPKVQLNVIERDKREVAAAYLGMTVQYGDRREAIPVVQNTYNLEYDLTSAIMKVTRAEDPVVGILTAPGTRPLDSLGMLRQTLEKQYKVRPIDLNSASAVPDDVRTLLIPGAGDLTEVQKFAIDQFIMKGGKALILIDPVTMEMGTLAASPNRSGLRELLAHYGFETDTALIADARSNAHAMFNQGYMRFSVPYPFWPRIRAGSFAAELPSVSMLESLVLPWTGAVGLMEGRLAEAGQAALLARTSEAAWKVQAPYDLNPQAIPQPQPGDLAARGLAASAIGIFPSFYAGKPVPTAPPAEGAPAAAPTPPAEPIAASPETRLVVVANSALADDQFLQMFPFNMDFLLNQVDWLALGDELIGIRSRQVTDRPIEEIGQGARTAIKYANVFGVSALVVAFGLVRLAVRRSRKRRFEEGLRS